MKMDMNALGNAGAALAAPKMQQDNPAGQRSYGGPAQAANNLGAQAPKSQR